MTEELKNRYCDFEDCRHKNAENICCLFNPNNCKFRKRIAELKKDKDYFSDNLDKQIEATLKLHKEYQELEKENAELKDDNKVMADNYSKMEQKFYGNLTKAKELLNMFLRLHYNPIVDEHTLFCKVEQFLNSEVEK